MGATDATHHGFHALKGGLDEGRVAALQAYRRRVF
jgi:hypothetical protein